jgi:endonuclease-8
VIGVPEGDTVHRTAAALDAALRGGRLVRLEAPGAAGPVPRPGTTIVGARAEGKHVLIGFDGDRWLHTHLGMHGSWRIGGDPEEPVPFGRPGTVALVATERAGATCRRARIVAFLGPGERRRHPTLRQLGPDLCAPSVDLERVERRARALLDPATPIGVVLLDQRPACGIGNVWRSEVLWVCGVDPTTPLGAVDPHDLRELYATASALLGRNLGGGRRRTLPEGLAVYRRTGRPCPRCGHPIASRRLGEQARTVWWCPGCQGGGR